MGQSPNKIECPDCIPALIEGLAFLVLFFGILYAEGDHEMDELRANPGLAECGGCLGQLFETFALLGLFFGVFYATLFQVTVG